MKIQLTLSGRNYDLAHALPSHLELPDDCSLDTALETVETLLPGGGRLADSCLIAVSGKHLGTRARHQARVLRDGDELLVLAPVAGG